MSKHQTPKMEKSSEEYLKEKIIKDIDELIKSSGSMEIVVEKPEPPKNLAVGTQPNNSEPAQPSKNQAKETQSTINANPTGTPQFYDRFQKKIKLKIFRPCQRINKAKNLSK